MNLHIANFWDAPRRTAVAAAAIGQGAVVVISESADGERLATQVTDGDAALLVPGNYGVAMKVGVNPLTVTESSGVPADWGSRLVTIAADDHIIEVGRGAILEFSDLTLLHSSLDPDNAGTLPSAGDALELKDGLFCEVGTVSAITSPIIARCFDVINGKVRIELV